MLRRIVAFAFLLQSLAILPAGAAETIKIAVIETPSTPSAVIGKWWANHMQYAVDQINAKGGILGGRKIEIVSFDSKGSPQGALIAFKGVTDQGPTLRFRHHRLAHRTGPDRRDCQAQCAQPGQIGAVPELRRSDT